MNASTAETVAERQARLARIGYDRERLQTVVDLPFLMQPPQYAAEREKIFRRSWLLVGNTDDLPERGSYFVYEVPTVKASLLVVRGQDDRVRVFHNACTHRGNKLIREGSGARNAFRCNFHGWAFSTEGDVRVVTDEAMFGGIDKSQVAQIRAGLIEHRGRNEKIADRLSLVVWRQFDRRIIGKSLDRHCDGSERRKPIAGGRLCGRYWRGLCIRVCRLGCIVCLVQLRMLRLLLLQLRPISTCLVLGHLRRCSGR